MPGARNALNAIDQLETNLIDQIGLGLSLDHAHPRA